MFCLKFWVSRLQRVELIGELGMSFCESGGSQGLVNAMRSASSLSFRILADLVHACTEEMFFATGFLAHTPRPGDPNRSDEAIKDVFMA